MAQRDGSVYKAIRLPRTRPFRGMEHTARAGTAWQSESIFPRYPWLPARPTLAASAQRSSGPTLKPDAPAQSRPVLAVEREASRARCCSERRRQSGSSGHLGCGLPNPPGPRLHVRRGSASCRPAGPRPSGRVCIESGPGWDASSLAPGGRRRRPHRLPEDLTPLPGAGTAAPRGRCRGRAGPGGRLRGYRSGRVVVPLNPSRTAFADSETSRYARTRPLP